MQNQIKTSFLFIIFTLFMCFNTFFIGNTAAQVNTASASDNYTFETIDVPGIEFLALTASSDFEDYAGNTPSADGEKMVGFTFIDGVFETHDFPGSKNTYFYALGNNGLAAGHYEDSDGLFHGVILEDGELRQYDFPNSVETEIYGYSDSTGALTGNFTDASGVRRGFSGETIVEFPGASETYADFVSGLGNIVGSYVDADGTYRAYLRGPGGSFATLDIPEIPNQEYFFLHGINDALVAVGRAKGADGVPLTFVGNPLRLQELKVPGAVSTEGWNVNQDGSVVGHYDTADGRRHGFIARPAQETIPRPPPDLSYTFESIDVPGIDFLAVTASSDFFDYAGNMRGPDGEKDVAFTLIDGVFKTYDFPDSQGTYFYALGNNGIAAGHYKDSDGLFHGVILENGELRQYDFPNSVQTEIYGYSDSTGALTGSFVDASGVRRGFSGDTIVEFPGAPETYADFVSWTRHIVGSYRDADGIYHAYMRSSVGRFLSIDLPNALNLEYFFLHGLNRARTVVGRAKAVGDVPRTYVGSPLNLKELQFPGAVSTEGWNINEDGSVVGHYDSVDGRRHGFIARLVPKAEGDRFGNIFNVTLTKGLNMLSLPLASPKPMTAKSLAGIAGATMVIALDAENQRFIGWTPDAPNDGFTIEGGQGYIANVPQTRNFAFVGSRWENQTEAAAPAISKVPEAWAFVVSGHLEGKSTFDGYQVIVHNLRTNSTITASVQGDYFAAATADLARRSVVQVGDVIELRVIGPGGNVESQNLTFKVTPENLTNAVLSVNLDSIGKPNQNQLLQNYPNPFNPETWIPYQLSQDSPVSVSIYDTTGKVIRSLSLGFQSAGFYNSRERAAFWDGKNTLGESVASGVYFYQLTTPTFQQTRRLVIVK
ncbi:MAG: T9SS type A sorting domain-containing protein [Candidatus Poribacteria bacterium]|nr:T9SS type A sorting domain-containing protein [Candidatus Poribacteria bacterium]